MRKELLGDQGQTFEDISIWLKMDGGGMYLMQGVAGVGKTFLLADIVDLIQTMGRPIITAPTHKALKVLKKFIGPKPKYSTIHSALGMKEFIDEYGHQSFRKDAMLGCPADNYTHIIIDEASMLDDNIFDEILKLSDQGRKILFVGDPLQIPPVNHPYSLPFDKAIRQEYNIGVSSLETVLRQALDSPIISFSMKIRENIHKPFQILNSQALPGTVGEVLFINQAQEEEFFIEKVLPLYKSEFYENDIDYVKVIGWTNKTVEKANQIIRTFLFGENLPKIIVGDKLIADAPVMNEEKRTLISTNDEMIVMDVQVDEEVLSEDYRLKYYKTRVRVINEDLFNEYMLKIIHEDSEEMFDELCRMQKNLAKTYTRGSYQSKSAWMDYYAFIQSWHTVKYSYGITAHRAQGSTYHTAVVLYWDIKKNRDIFERNRIFYTASTRPSNNLYIIY